MTEPPLPKRSHEVVKRGAMLTSFVKSSYSARRPVRITKSPTPILCSPKSAAWL